MGRNGNGAIRLAKTTEVGASLVQENDMVVVYNSNLTKITKDTSTQTEVKPNGITQPGTPSNSAVNNVRRRGRPAAVTKTEIVTIKPETLEMSNRNLKSRMIEDVSNNIKQEIQEKGNLDSKNEDEKVDEQTNSPSALLPSKRRSRGLPPKHLNVYLTDTNTSSHVTKEEVMNETESENETEHEGDGNDYACSDCPYSTTNSYHFRRHKQAHSYSLKYKCDTCDFASPKLKNLLKHKREHLHADNLCSFCEYKAGSLEEMESHLQMHTGELPYFCVYCNTRFKTKTQLKVHLPKHSKVKPFVCNVCKAAFKWKHALKNHMITHSDSKDHLCDVCGFSTAHKSQLKAHRLIHTGETFKCNHPGCLFQATKKQNLKYHMLTHTHEKPHQCEICGQSFSLSKNMKRHMLLHTNERPYKCTKCVFSTTRYDKLRHHTFKQHGEGELPKKRFRISDYPKSLVPDPEMMDFTLAEEIEDCASLEDLQVRVENTMTTGGKENEGSETHEQQIYITNPNGESFPITLARIENVNTTGTGSQDISYQTIQFVTQVE